MLSQLQISTLISSPRTDHPLKPDIKRANQPTRNEDKTEAQTQKNGQIPRPNPTKFPPPDSQNGAAAYGKPTPTKLRRDKPRQSRGSQANLTNVQLTKADETSANDENEVRREDQEKINRFSRLHQRETVLEEQLKGKQVWSFDF
jgi:hypothetical protein